MQTSFSPYSSFFPTPYSFSMSINNPTPATNINVTVHPNMFDSNNKTVMMPREVVQEQWQKECAIKKNNLLKFINRTQMPHDTSVNLSYLKSHFKIAFIDLKAWPKENEILDLFEKVFTRTLLNKSNMRNWSPEEILILFWISYRYSLYKSKPMTNLNDEDWSFLAEIIPGKTWEDCKFKWLSLTKVSLHKNPWTSQEDVALSRVIGTNPSHKIKWKEIAWNLHKIVGGIVFRSSKQCRERWNNHLDPTIKKGSWSTKEDIILLETIQEIGKKWALIAKKIPGRNENCVKNRFNSLMNREHRMFPLKSKHYCNDSLTFSSKEQVLVESLLNELKSKSESNQSFQSHGGKTPPPKDKKQMPLNISMHKKPIPHGISMLLKENLKQPSNEIKEQEFLNFFQNDLMSYETPKFSPMNNQNYQKTAEFSFAPGHQPFFPLEFNNIPLLSFTENAYALAQSNKGNNIKYESSEYGSSSSSSSRESTPMNNIKEILECLDSSVTSEEKHDKGEYRSKNTLKETKEKQQNKRKRRANFESFMKLQGSSSSKENSPVNKEMERRKKLKTTVDFNKEKRRDFDSKVFPGEKDEIEEENFDSKLYLEKNNEKKIAMEEEKLTKSSRKNVNGLKLPLKGNRKKVCLDNPESDHPFTRSISAIKDNNIAQRNLAINAKNDVNIAQQTPSNNQKYLKILNKDPKITLQPSNELETKLILKKEKPHQNEPDVQKIQVMYPKEESPRLYRIRKCDPELFNERSMGLELALINHKNKEIYLCGDVSKGLEQLRFLFKKENNTKN